MPGFQKYTTLPIDADILAENIFESDAHEPVPVDFQLLGPVEVALGGRNIALGPKRQRTTFAALLVDADRPVSLDTLINRVWDESPTSLF